ncbi:chloroplastic acetylcoenzyme A carboxylase 1 [Striga asiatica]|uniref:Chloroplastic acetylcoenzyme A carboxylase 1 n=1 Tax=Striga asiatica TaxID=4170 RepID=A0A5A7PGE2_STRAF|nr:chloroplastic acetylcoenzyme A carboxylase 1 [Striga asiatica]
MSHSDAAVDLLIRLLQSKDGSVNVLERDESVALGFSGTLIGDNDGVGFVEFAVGREHLAKFIGGGLPAEAANEEFTLDGIRVGDGAHGLQDIGVAEDGGAIFSTSSGDKAPVGAAGAVPIALVCSVFKGYAKPLSSALRFLKTLGERVYRVSPSEEKTLLRRCVLKPSLIALIIYSTSQYDAVSSASLGNESWAGGVFRPSCLVGKLLELELTTNALSFKASSSPSLARLVIVSKFLYKLSFTIFLINTFPSSSAPLRSSTGNPIAALLPTCGPECGPTLICLSSLNHCSILRALFRPNGLPNKASPRST